MIELNLNCSIDINSLASDLCSLPPKDLVSLINNIDLLMENNHFTLCILEDLVNNVLSDDAYTKTELRKKIGL